MKRPKLRKASKRMSCAKRYKIQKKVREHNRKLKKEGKKKGTKRVSKKDPGVPSSAPFKEEVLREAEQKRLQIEEEKERRKQAGKEERAKKRKREKEAGSKEKERKAKKARQDKTAKGPGKENTTKRNSQKSFCAELNKVIDASDVVLEVLDARDPLGCRCPQLEEAVLQRGGKKLLFVLNKIDLVPRVNVGQWIQILQQEFPVVAFSVPRPFRQEKTQLKRRRIKPSIGLFKGTPCFGATILTKLFGRYAANKKAKSRLRVGVVGFPNVGKSSLINSLKGSQACIVDRKRGVTKFMQEVHMSQTVNLVDSPAILACPSNPVTTMALRSLHIGERADEAVRTLLTHCDKTEFILEYNIADFRNSDEFLTLLAKKRGFLKSGGILNKEQASLSFLDDWTGATLRYHCKTSDQHRRPAYVTDTVVTEMWAGQDRKKLQSGNRKTLNSTGIKFPSARNSISFVSNGPTAGLMVVSDIPEETVAVGPSEEEDDEPENTEPDESADETTDDEPETVSPKETTNHVQFKAAPISTTRSTEETDDAYDFNAYF
ncbi:guanine nucleotide-binding protein-like 3 [Syngnathoides biaculeatus]|uniref:guanine nucleotide-binding protein-like 3 n=1 Tax=Syngnathoides biaculeatus TaxID=300417 RepID=UPI002ADE1671|nr:guanine nucleotide-binding protein-like 3 [Syngnathoides biaculeatus]